MQTFFQEAQYLSEAYRYPYLGPLCLFFSSLFFVKFHLKGAKTLPIAEVFQNDVLIEVSHRTFQQDLHFDPKAR